MRSLAFIGILLLLGSCTKDELSSLSIANRTDMPIYAQPFTSAYADGDWIEPGGCDEFFSIEHGDLDGFEYFSFFYDSLVVFLNDSEEHPVKFYKDGRTVNYDPEMNPFTNRDMWNIHQLNRVLPGNTFESLEEKEVMEHFFSINPLSIPSITDTIQDI